MEFSQKDIEDLRDAKALLDNPGIAIKMANFIGIPIEKGFALLPQSWSANVAGATQKALSAAINAALLTMGNRPSEVSHNIWHKISVMFTGGVSGFFGLPALAAELPVSTTIMLRSIADIARSEGALINDIKTKMACIEVFALGGPEKSDDSVDSAYFTTRAALAKSLLEATEHIAERGFIEEGAPVLLRFIINVAERFSIQVSEKVAAQAIPVAGAIGGAVINTLFINHFQAMARGHFIVLRLERKYGPEKVKLAYAQI
ncbi:EcsC family protein [Desulfococcaceae bacterium HSG9]|nr:EcsC family protein [Desulfococcaceae bacterium HSG9]